MRAFGRAAFAVTFVAFAACAGRLSKDGSGDGPATTPSACERFQSADSLKDACSALGGGCPQTLRGYLASGHVAPHSYARVGCGLTEIRDVVGLDAGASQANTYAFDDTGALVGFERSYQDDSALCGTGEYTFGALLGACDSVRECHIPEDAADVADVCGCTCPDPPPVGGIFRTNADCVYPAHPIVDCESELSGELARYADSGLTLRYGCGFVVTGDPSVLQCSYDPSGMLAGAYRADPDLTCAAVIGFQTGTPYVACESEQECIWGTGSDGVFCGDTPPDAGGSECAAWQAETDVAASCALVGACPADERSYLDGLADPTTVKAVLGCGITWFTPAGGNVLGGSAFAFDKGGALVGYDFWSDSPFGPCADQPMNEYTGGDDLSTCAAVESCTLHDASIPPCR
jgi:hypothetical protein